MLARVDAYYVIDADAGAPLWIIVGHILLRLSQQAALGHQHYSILSSTSRRLSTVRP